MSPIKILLPFIWIVMLTFNVSAQKIYFFENKVIDKSIPRTSESYSSRFVRLSKSAIKTTEDKFHIGMIWQPISSDEIVGCNVWLIGKFNIVTHEFDTIHYDKTSNILELTANSDAVYFLETENELLRFDEFELKRYEFGTKNLTKLRISKSYNITNLSVSMDDQHLAFIDYQDNLSTLYILNIASGNINKVETAFQPNEELGDVEGSFGLNWNNNQLQYCKISNELAALFTYNPISKSKKTETVEFGSLEEFKYAYRLGTTTFALNGNDVQKNETGTWESVYKVAYKYDYLGKTLKVIDE